jgi:chaperone modulatory protein CbpM
MTVQHYVLMPRAGLSVEQVARRSGVHPDMVRRFVALGLLPCRQDACEGSRLDPSAVAVIARIQRLRAGLGLNYAAIGLVLDLLDRIDELESQSRRERTRPWTSTD